MLIDNFPIQPTSFVGRTEELGEISNLLDTPACRLLTLVGPGGIGKTRLALEAASQPDSFRDGIYFISLQSLGSPEHIVSTIASAVNFQFFPGGDPRQQLLNYLRNKHLLLLLDNFEHLLDGADLVSDLLSTAPAARLVVTSRERLNLSSETVFHVGGLPVPGSETADNLLDYGAVALFIQSARQVHHDFSVDNTDLSAIAHICRLVGGMPLAIVLSAAWVDLLSLQEIAAEIERGLEFLETEMRDLPERHRSVRATFDYSWRRLSESERDVFKKLSVFRGGFSREAAQAVTGASLKTLMSLVNKSFVQTVGGGRYDLHELLRQYGAALLNASASERDTVRALHAAYYAEFTRQRHLDFIGTNVKPALDAVGADYDNIRVAWDAAVQRASWDDLWKLADSFMDFSWHLNRLEDALNPYAQAVTKLEEIGASGQDEELLATLLAHQGFICLIHARDFDPAAYQRAVTLMRQYPPSNPVAALGLCFLGFCVAHRVELSEGEQLLRDCIALCQTMGYAYGQIFSNLCLMITFSNHKINGAEVKTLIAEVFDLLEGL
jgi:predicted ATPase